MHAHLTNEELTGRLMGEPSMTIDAHLIECSDCRREFDELKESIGLFRGAAQAWSAEAAVVRGFSQREAAWTMPRWALAVAVLLLVFLPALYLRQHRSLPDQAKVIPMKVLSAQAQIDQDNQLLSAVNSELSEAVPAPMQPLQLTDNNDSSTSAK